MTNNNKIPEIVKQYRNEHGRSLRTFAENLSEIPGVDVSYQSIKNWEDGTHKPSFQTLVRMLEYLGTWQQEFADEVMSELIQDIFTPTEEA